MHTLLDTGTDTDMPIRVGGLLLQVALMELGLRTEIAPSSLDLRRAVPLGLRSEMGALGKGRERVDSDSDCWRQDEEEEGD